jgi:PAS domain S-box-containing protein
MDPSLWTDPPAAGPDGEASTLFELLPVGAYRSTPEGSLLRANLALVRFNGYTTEAELLARCRDVAHEWYVDPQQRQRFVQRLEREGQVTGMVSEVYRHFSRERAWVSENAHIVRHADGSVHYYEGTVEEITDRVRAERALQRSEAHLRLITQHLPCMVYRLVTQPDGARRYTFVSDGVRAIFGITPEALMADADALRPFRHPEDQALVLALITQALAPDQGLDFEYRILLPDGSLKWVHVRSTTVPPAEHEQGQVRIGVLIDVTAQKQAESWRAERDRAEAADRTKTQLLSRVSHELRTPLNAVLGFAELLVSDGTLGPRHRQWTQHIVDSGRHLLGLVDDVLDVSAAQAGQLNLSCVPLDLRRAVMEAWTMLAVAGTSVSLHEAGSPLLLPPVLADPRRLKQVLGNLLSNAIKYNRPGGRIELRFALPPPAADGGVSWVQLVIADSGIGMNAEQVARLFMPFERLGAQHTGVPGTGLGLALSKQLVEAMGGQIEARSTPGIGTEFTLRLRCSATADHSQADGTTAGL